MWDDENNEFVTEPEIENFFEHYTRDENFIKNRKSAHYLSTDQKFLHVYYIWGFSSKITISKYSNGLDRANGQTDEIISNGYLDFFVNILKKTNYDFNKIEYIKIGYVDRGIPTFRTFGNMLKDLFPNLKVLGLKQNWSYCGKDVSDKDLIKDYLYMLQLLQLDKFMIESSYFDNISNEELFKVLKNNSVYIQINDNTKNDYYFDEENNKKIILFDQYIKEI